jgi:hypothetical protein
MGLNGDGGRRAVRLRLTPLEDRTLPASAVVASLNAGILRISDYQAADALVLRQSPTAVTVDATNTHLVYAGVNRMTLDVRYDDRVTNDVTALGGVPTRAVYLNRRDPTGRTFISGGLLVAGGNSLPVVEVTPTTDWFTRSLDDAGLRSLARSVSADGVIGRLDMLALFAQATKDGTITANEIHDFKVLEHPAWTVGGTMTQSPLFTMPDPVRGLLSEVVDGDPANATYQGALLGNLQVGDSAAKFQKLVNKWFLGMDHPVAKAGTTYQQANGTLFGSGAAMTDVHQGNLSDCYYLAALANLALDRSAAIPSMFTDNRDGTFTVRFFDSGVAKYVTVDRTLPADGNGTLVYDGAGSSVVDPNNKLWAPLAEKAYAQINAEGWLGHAATNSYPAIEEGFSDDALMQITGGTAGWTAIIRSSSASLQAAVTAGKPTILNSLSSPGNGVVANHTYPVVGYDANVQKFNLFNPQGGFIQLTWTQITQSFSGYWQLQ